MSYPFLGEIRIFAMDFPPKGWARCEGQLLAIAQHSALFSLLGVMYGGNGTTTFALPNLMERVPIHPGNGVPLGGTGGAETRVLTTAELPAHAHAVRASSRPGLATEPPGYPAAGGPYGGGGPEDSLRADTVPVVGESQPVSVMQPYLSLQFCIAVQGIFPSRW